MQIKLDRNSVQPLYTQLAQDILRRIRSGALPPGARLPTVRELAQQLGVTRLTVHNAYSELQAGGWVEATVGRGTFVTARTEPLAEVAQPDREISPHSMINDMLRMAQHPSMRSLAMADAATEFLPVREMERAIDEALTSNGAALLGYGTSQGDPLLRVILAELLRERGLTVAPDEIVITSGATQAVALIAQTLARPGDAVIVEQPTYLGALNILHTHGLHPVGVPVDEEGMSVDLLEQLIVTHHPRFIYSIPVFQNPSGVCLSQRRRVALLELAERYQVPIIEDDIYNQLAYEGPPPPALQAEDQTGLVLHIGSFSKSLLPGLRIGYIAATPHMIKRLVAAKQANDLCSSPLFQRALAIFIQHGWFASHLRRTVPLYRQRRDALLAAMARSFPSDLRWTKPQGGFCSWVTLPLSTSVTDLYLAAIERGVAFTPGDVFFAGPAPRPYMRLSFSTQPPHVIDEVVQTIGELLSVHLRRRVFDVSLVTNYLPLV